MFVSKRVHQQDRLTGPRAILATAIDNDILVCLGGLREVLDESIATHVNANCAWNVPALEGRSGAHIDEQHAAIMHSFRLRGINDRLVIVCKGGGDTQKSSQQRRDHQPKIHTNILPVSQPILPEFCKVVEPRGDSALIALEDAELAVAEAIDAQLCAEALVDEIGAQLNA